MKKVAHIISLCLVCAVVACNSEQEQGVLQESIEGDASGAIKEVADTTLQPKVEITLHAVGNTPEEMKFEPDTLTVPEDALVKLNLVNEGTALTIIHNFVLVTEGKYKKVGMIGAEVGPSGNYTPKSEHVFAATPLALPGQTIVHEFTAPPPGTYDFVCTYPEHWKKMHGKFVVKK